MPEVSEQEAGTPNVDARDAGGEGGGSVVVRRFKPATVRGGGMPTDGTGIAARSRALRVGVAHNPKAALTISN